MPVPQLPRLEDADVTGRRVLIRADLNVPMEDGEITDDFRINAFLPTLEYLMSEGARCVVCTHLGRPKGPDPAFRTRPIARALGRAIGREVTAVPEVVGTAPGAACAALERGHVVLLENLRFEPGETTNDDWFAGQLAELADVYVNDAFGASHRAHASIVAVARKLPAYAGFLLREEVETLGGFLEDPPRPFVMVLGGAKVADKVGIVKNLLDRADKILIGGGMCFTFLRARGHDVGRSLVDESRLDEVKALLQSDTQERIVLPIDVIVADAIDASEGRLVSRLEIPSDAMGLDIGLSTSENFAKIVRGAGSLFWNGPMGVFENKAFSGGTRTVATAVSQCEGYTVTGGGDTAAAMAEFDLADEVDFASTGGGAALEFLEGRTLPGIEVLQRASGSPGRAVEPDIS